MAALDIFALFVLLVLIGTGGTIFVVLAMLPGRIAQERGHPNAEAIAVGGWVALLAGGVLWPLMLIWAYYRDPYWPRQEEADSGEAEGGDA